MKFDATFESLTPEIRLPLNLAIWNLSSLPPTVGPFTVIPIVIANPRRPKRSLCNALHHYIMFAEIKTWQPYLSEPIQFLQNSIYCSLNNNNKQKQLIY